MVVKLMLLPQLGVPKVNGLDELLEMGTAGAVSPNRLAPEVLFMPVVGPLGEVVGPPKGEGGGGGGGSGASKGELGLSCLGVGIRVDIAKAEASQLSQHWIAGDCQATKNVPGRC